METDSRVEVKPKVRESNSQSEVTKDTREDNSRQTRIRRPPARLDDYIVYQLQSANERIDAKTAANQMARNDHSVANGQSGPKVQLANCISGDYQISNQDKDLLSVDDIKTGAGESSNYSQLNFQRRHTLENIMLNPDPESSSRSDLLDESRFSDIRESTPVQDRTQTMPKETLPSLDEERKTVHAETFVSKETRTEVMKLYSHLKESRTCDRCDRHFGSLGDEQLRIHAWSHYTAAVCKLCGFLRGRTDQLKDHRRKEHPGVKENITLKIDRENWKLANRSVRLPEPCPAFPVVIDRMGKPKPPKTVEQRDAREVLKEIQKRTHQSPRKAQLIDSPPVEKRTRAPKRLRSTTPEPYSPTRPEIMTDIIAARKRVRHDSGISTDSSTHKYPECYQKKERTGSDITRPMDNFTRSRIETIEAKIAQLNHFLAMNKNLEVVVERELNQIRAELVRLKFPVNTY